MRLIDADKGIKEYKELRRKLIEKGADLFGDEIDGLDYIIRQLELQPTAYDVEAVVRALEEKIKFYENQEKRQMELDCGMAACHTNGVQQGIKFTIDVVKRGGRNE